MKKSMLKKKKKRIRKELLFLMINKMKVQKMNRVNNDHEEEKNYFFNVK